MVRSGLLYSTSDDLGIIYYNRSTAPVRLQKALNYFPAHCVKLGLYNSLDSVFCCFTFLCLFSRPVSTSHFPSLPTTFDAIHAIQELDEIPPYFSEVCAV